MNTTHDQHAKTFEQEYAEPPTNTPPTTYDLAVVQRYSEPGVTEQQSKSDDAEVIADLIRQLTTARQELALSKASLAALEESLSGKTSH